VRRKPGAEGTGDPALAKGQAMKQLDATQSRVLPELVPSVTEHTTRTLEPIYSERKSE